MKDKLLVICGPTATGKTQLAASIAKKFDGELISADSRQVYRGMDITTGKDRPDVPVWLYDVVEPDEAFSVSRWISLAKEAIANMVKRKKLPIVVGGTGLYIKALLEPFDTIDIPPNEEVRKKLAVLSLSELQQMVERGDMNDSDWQNPRRLIRKIEIGQSGTRKKQEKMYNALVIGLTASVPQLNLRIDRRLEGRMQMGLEEEAAALLAKYDKSLPSMSVIGLNEHAYARRQMTWFKKQKNIFWFDIMDAGLEDKVTKKVVDWYEN